MSTTGWTRSCGTDAPRPTTRTASVCSECDAASARTQLGFNDLSVVPEEEGGEGARSNVESPCTCEECQPEPVSTKPTSDSHIDPSNGPKMSQQRPANNVRPKLSMVDNAPERTVDVLVHDAPIEPPRFFESLTSAPYHVATPPPPPGFVLSPYQTPRFHTGGNVDDLLGEVQASPILQTSFIQQNSIFMCNTRKVTQKPCCCQKTAERPTLRVNGQPEGEKPKCYVTEKNIELNYDYPRSTPIKNGPNPKPVADHHGTTTEVASTVVFVERRIPVRPKKFDFFFRSRSAPVGDNEEPVYATVNKLPKRLRRMELANLEKEVAYKTGEPETSTRTDVTVKTDSEQSRIPHPDDDTSPSEREKSTAPQRPDTPKVKKRKRFSLTFKKRERKKRDKKKEVVKNGTAKNGGPMHVETESERLIEVPETQEGKQKHCARHRTRNTMSSSSSGPRYKRDSYQEMTTSHSEHEHTNSVCSSMNSLASACTHKSRKLSAPPTDSIPWCGCWGAGCV